jgi:hypothetical protein
MRKINKSPFLLAAMRVMHQLDRVLKSGGAQWPTGAPFDLTPYVSAMLKLCAEKHIEDHPIGQLRQVAHVMAALRGPVSPADLKAGADSAAQYERWLSSTFPEVFAEMRREASERAQKHALN